MPVAFKPQFEIAGRPLGAGAPVLVIAEAGVAHFGDMELARALVDLAAEARADVFKTQIFDVDALFAAGAAEWRQRLRPRNLTLDQFQELKARCDAAGLLFMATAHDESRLPWLQALQVPAVKIGSGERNNPGFLRKLAGLGKPVILSTGMYGADDVHEALAALAAGGAERVALLHCVTSYPTPDADVNLAAMDHLRTLFPGPVGYSDYTSDHMALLAAVARGAQVVEKHITILRDVPDAQDWKVSAGPEDFPALVADIRRLEVLLGHGRKEAAPSEAAGMAWALKSVVAAGDLEAGRKLRPDDLSAKRPGGGVPANRLREFIGRRLRHGVSADTALSFEDVE
ncbi:MAG TPA: N-acetylneuraminate synthase family protein [Alphaproteobacteria bacterium]|nr:N-acetylneuraminate synthase family protein [Alphaproteobacteria bacterium]